MSVSASFHGPLGRSDFLGMRSRSRGQVEIVYDDGIANRMVWRVVQAKTDPEVLRTILSSAVRESRVVPTMISELRRRAIQIEIVAS